MPVHKLTSRNVRSLRPAEGRRTDYFDPAVTGFHLRVSPTGARSFAVFYRTKAGEQRRLTIGDVDAVSLAGGASRTAGSAAAPEPSGAPFSTRSRFFATSHLLNPRRGFVQHQDLRRPVPSGRRNCTSGVGKGNI